MRKVWCAVGIAFIGYGILFSFMSNITVGKFLVLFIGIVFLFLAMPVGRHKKAVRIWKRVCAACLCCIFCASAFLALYGRCNTSDYTEDVLIVPGAGLRGEIPAEPLRLRLAGAVDYYHRNNRAYILVSGGMGNGETVSEAAAMEKYLMDAGVPESQIIKEEKASSTSENFLFSREILNEFFGEKSYRMCFITNRFHVFRTNYTAKKTGFTQIGHIGVNTPTFTVPVNYIRECAACLKYLLFV